MRPGLHLIHCRRQSKHPLWGMVFLRDSPHNRVALKAMGPGVDDELEHDRTMHSM
jgi:hypothetical protein